MDSYKRHTESMEQSWMHDLSPLLGELGCNDEHLEEVMWRFRLRHSDLRLVGAGQLLPVLDHRLQSQLLSSQQLDRFDRSGYYPEST